MIVVGQQDRRQLAFEPFLTGRALDRLAGEYPVWANTPIRAQDVPGAIARAYHEAKAASGPALVVVPMGDWEQPADELAAAAPAHVIRPASVMPAELDALVDLVEQAHSPTLVVGAGSDSPEGWIAAVALAERLNCPVWQEPFGGRAGFPQDHPQFAGHLHWRRRLMREALAPHDLVLVLGTNAFRLYLYEQPEPPVAPGTRVAVITADAAEAHRSPAELAVVGPVAAVCGALAGRLAQREGPAPEPMRRPPPPAPPAPGEPLQAGHVLQALADRLPADAVLLEESPSSRPELHQRIPARAPLGFVSGANGGLGFGLSGAIGLRMGLPDRPVVGVIGDGSALFAIQALWSAARYDVGVLLIVMANGGYGVMDAQASARGGTGAWPGFPGIDIAGISRGLGCPAMRVETHDELIAALDETRRRCREPDRTPTDRGESRAMSLVIDMAGLKDTPGGNTPRVHGLGGDDAAARQRFRGVTNDHNYIHVDVERAKSSPFGGTIAHGYLTLSLLAPVTQGLLQVTDASTGINYGLDRVRFPAPLPVGAQWRGGAEIAEVTEVAGGLQVKLVATVEVKGTDKPALVAECLLRVYAVSDDRSRLDRRDRRAHARRAQPARAAGPGDTSRCSRRRPRTSAATRRSRPPRRSPTTTASGACWRSCSRSTTRPAWGASASATRTCSRRRAPIPTC